MRKIIEGIFGFKNDHDGVFAQTENLPFEDNEQLLNVSPLFVDLNHFDDDRGLVDEVARLSTKVFAYAYSGDNRLYFSKHQNIEHDVAGRGKQEIVHFVLVDKSANIRSVSLEKLDIFHKDLSPYVVGQASSLPEITSNLENDSITYNQFRAKKAQLIDLLDHIIYSKKQGRTLYICYPMGLIKEFHEDFFLALKLLPVSICNDISFVTNYGGGTTSKYDIVGVAIEEEEIENRGYSSAGIVYQYPYDDIITPKEEIINNYLHTVLANIINEKGFNDFINFLSIKYNGEQDFDAYLDFIKTFNGLIMNVQYNVGKEDEYISALYEKLLCLYQGLAILQTFKRNELESLLEEVRRNIGEMRNVTDFSPIGQEVVKTLELLVKLHKETSIELIRVASLAWLYDYIFRFDHSNRDNIFIYSHADLINRALKENQLSQELIRYIIENDKYNDTNDLMTNSFTNNEKGQECKETYYCELFNYLFNNYKADVSNRARITEVVLGHLYSIININELVKLIFHNNEDIYRSFLIIDECIVKVNHYSEFNPDEFISEVSGYVKYNGLLLEGFKNVNPSKYPSPDKEKVAKLETALIEAFIDASDKVKSYELLDTYIDKITTIEDNDLRSKVKDYFILRYVDEEVAVTIDAVPLSRIEEVKAKLLKILEFLKDYHEQAPTNIVAAIQRKIGEAEEYASFRAREDELREFRIEFILQTLLILPEKDSREIVYEYIGEELTADKIGKHLNLSSEEYTKALYDVAKEFLTKQSNYRFLKGGTYQQCHANFAKAVFDSQSKKRFNIHTIGSIAESVVCFIIFGAIFFGLSFGTSMVLYNFVTNKTYFMSYLIMSLAIGVVSAFISLFNLQNKGRKKVYLISILESLALLIAVLGIFTLLVFLWR